MRPYLRVKGRGKIPVKDKTSKEKNRVFLMFYQLSVFSDGEICCAAGTLGLARLASPSGITEAKMRPACSAFGGFAFL